MAEVEGITRYFAEGTMVGTMGDSEEAYLPEVMHSLGIADSGIQRTEVGIVCWGKPADPSVEHKVVRCGTGDKSRRRHCTCTAQLGKTWHLRRQ